MSNRPHNRRSCVWCRVDELFAAVYGVPHGGYRVGRHKLQTTNTIAFYRWQFECTEILRQAPDARCCASHPPAITSCFSMIMRGPMSQGSVLNFGKLIISQQHATLIISQQHATLIRRQRHDQLLRRHRRGQLI